MDVYAWLMILAMGVGLIGTFVPMVPGFWIVFASILVYGIFDQWSAYPIWYVVIVGVLAVASSFLDYVGTMIGAKKFGASNMTAIGGTVGSVAGGIIANLPGTVVGAAVGAIGAEYKEKRSIKQAIRAAFGTLIGTGVTAFLQFIVALIITIVTIVFVWGAAV